jgi:hypothetical protein
MQIRTRTYVSLGGYVSMPSGMPVQLALPAFIPDESHGHP